MMDFNRRTKILKFLSVFILVLIFGYACVEPFNPHIPAGEIDVLIVEGYINAGPGKTRIALSKVSSLQQSATMLREQDAHVTIESDTDESYLLSEGAFGVYESEELNLPTNKKYRIYIKLKNGSEYRSELLNVKITPPIDSLHWEFNQSVYIYANTHTDDQSALYYKWDYREDWQVRSTERAKLVYRNDTIEDRPIEEQVQMLNCWSSATSSGLIFSSSNQFPRDVMKYPVHRVPMGGDRTSVMYSIIVDQHTLTEEEYNYLTLVVKNTTELGTFFDPMPSQLFGNITDLSDVDKQVIGYVGVYTTQSDTLFIDANDLPPIGNQQSCDTVHFENTPGNLESFFSGDVPSLIPRATFYKLINGVSIPWVEGVDAYCLDCRRRASPVKPEFWP